MTDPLHKIKVSCWWIHQTFY